MERPENFHFDTRIQRRILAKGGVTQEQVDAHLRNLPDREGHFIVLDVPQPAVSPAPMSTPPSPQPVAEPAPPPVAPFASSFDRFSPAAVPSATTLNADEDEAPLTPVMLNPRDFAASASPEESVDDDWDTSGPETAGSPGVAAAEPEETDDSDTAESDDADDDSDTAESDDADDDSGTAESDDADDDSDDDDTEGEPEGSEENP